MVNKINAFLDGLPSGDVGDSDESKVVDDLKEEKEDN